jgi:hypothetical protein
MFGQWASNQRSKSRNVDGTDPYLARKQAIYEELIIPYGEFGVVFLSAILVVGVLLARFSVPPIEKYKSLGAEIGAFLSDNVSPAVQPENARSRGSKGSSALYASQIRTRKAHKTRHHNEFADQRARQLVRLQTVDCSGSGKDKATNGVKPGCQLTP